jgi:hypothetical protein
MATIVRRPGKNGQQVYRVQVRRKGAPPLSATFTKLSDARKWVQVTEAAILEGRYFPTTEAKRHTLADLIDRYCRDILPSKAPESHRKHASNSAGGVGTVCLRILLRAALPSTATR